MPDKDLVSLGNKSFEDSRKQMNMALSTGARGKFNRFWDIRNGGALKTPLKER